LLVDTHCHLYFESFDEDLQQVLARSVDEGVGRILCPGIDLKTSREAVSLAEAYPQVYAAVGVHPNDSLSWMDGTIDELRLLADHPKVVAIGEIGLDYYRDRAPKEFQQQVFREQLMLAAETALPVVIHTRNSSGGTLDAMEDALNILANWQTDLAATSPLLYDRPGVFHSYSGNEEIASRAMHLNFQIGFTGPVTFQNAPDLQRVVGLLPLDHMLIETDAPFLTPHPHRGKRNEPSFVRLVAEKIAQIHNLPFDVVADITTNNAGRLFNWRVTN
jgi:TatD DNase family protein